MAMMGERKEIRRGGGWADEGWGRLRRPWGGVWHRFPPSPHLHLYEKPMATASVSVSALDCPSVQVLVYLALVQELVSATVLL